MPPDPLISIIARRPTVVFLVALFMRFYFGGTVKILFTVQVDGVNHEIVFGSFLGAAPCSQNADIKNRALIFGFFIIKNLYRFFALFAVVVNHFYSNSQIH